MGSPGRCLSYCEVSGYSPHPSHTFMLTSSPKAECKTPALPVGFFSCCRGKFCPVQNETGVPGICWPPPRGHLSLTPHLQGWQDVVDKYPSSLSRTTRLCSILSPGAQVGSSPSYPHLLMNALCVGSFPSPSHFVTPAQGFLGSLLT